jgi:hypothetical protein
VEEETMDATTDSARSLRGVARAGLAAAALAVTGNTIMYGVSGLLKVSFTMPTPDGAFSITLMHVITETVVMVVGAVLVFALLRRLTTRAVPVFRVIAVVVLLVSFLFPMLLLAEPPLKITLLLMHLFSAAVIVGLLTWGESSPLD